MPKKLLYEIERICKRCSGIQESKLLGEDWFPKVAGGCGVKNMVLWNKAYVGKLLSARTSLKTVGDMVA